MKKIILLGLALLSVHLSFAQNNRNNAEVFIQIEDRGNFTVYLDDEFIGSSNGRFRFYEVYSFSPTLTILQGNKRIYSRKISAKPDERVVLSYSNRNGLQLRKQLKMYRNGQYALDDFEDYAGAYNTGIVPPQRPIDNNQFESLNALVKKEAFDDAKSKLVLAYTAHTKLTTAQTALLLKSFIRDEEKLNLTKSLIPAIVDPQNYYTLRESFTFLNTKEAFLNYLSTNQTVRAERGGMRPAAFEQAKLTVKREAFDEGKTKVIRAIIQNASLNTAQAMELLKLYSFEDNALASAKMLYPVIDDLQNYFLAKEVFKFKSNQDAFLDFLGRQ